MIISNQSPSKSIENFRTMKAGLPEIDRLRLQQICRMPIDAFSKMGKRYDPPGGKPYFFIDNGADVLAIAHTDVHYMGKPTHFSIAKMAHDTRYFCPSMDDRAGVYALTDYLPKVGLNFDILLTTDEENLNSSAQWFVPPKGKKYNWMFMFDRAGVGVVMYDYENYDSTKLLRNSGWQIESGSYSCIVELEHLRCKGFNFGVGYHDQHTLNCYLSEKEFLYNMRRFISFYKTNATKYLRHTPRYNIYLREEGFGYFTKAGKSHIYQDTFTDSDIELIETLEQNDFQFPASLSKETIDSVFEGIRREEIRNQEAQLSLFEDVTEAVGAIANEDSVCIPCGGTGISSKGGECWPCAGTGIQGYRNRVINIPRENDSPRMIVFNMGVLADGDSQKKVQELSAEASRFEPVVETKALVETRDETKAALVAHSVIKKLNASKGFDEQHQDIDMSESKVNHTAIGRIAVVVPQGGMKKHGNKTKKETFQKVGPGGSWVWCLEGNDGKTVQLNSIVQVNG